MQFLAGGDTQVFESFGEGPLYRMTIRRARGDLGPRSLDQFLADLRDEVAAKAV